MRRLLVLRPEPGASATVERALERGLDAIATPLFKIEPIPWKAPDAALFDGLLITSANAVRAAGDPLQELRELKVYAVGNATADAARDAGFDVAAKGDAGVQELLGSLDEELKLLHCCGEDRHQLHDARQQITPVTVYRSKPIASPELCAEGAVVLIHSRRAGQRFAELVSDRDSIAIGAISTAAAALVGDGWQSVAIADRPTEEALLALAARLCNNPDPK